jgi:hypothetical protein
MILNEFIKETDKNQMVSTLLKYYGVGSVKMKMVSIKDHAHFNVDTGTLELSKRYKNLKDSQVKDFLKTVIHEIDHAMDAKKYGWKKFKQMYEFEMEIQIQAGNDEYDDNKFEIKAEKFGQKNWKQWYNRFKKQKLI